MDDSNLINSIINASVEASDRCRYLMITMIIVSIFSFTQYWNHRENNWFHTYIKYSEAGSKYLMLKELLLEDQLKGVNESRAKFENPSKSNDKNKFQVLNNMNEISKKALDILREYDPEASENLTRDLNNSNRNIDSPFLNKIRADLLTEQSKIENRNYEQQVKIDFPFFQLSFHQNDLSLFSGLSFTAILLILCFSLSREIRNLNIVFDEARKRLELSKIYMILSMKQVLTIPRNPLVNPSFTYKIQSFLPKIILILPAIVQILLCIEDFATRGNMNKLEEALVTQHVVLSFGFCLLISICCILAFMLSSGNDEVWDKAVVDIQSGKFDA